MMRRTLGAALAAAAVLSVAGCGDDANDGAYQMRRAAALAEELRLASTTTAPPADDPTETTVDGVDEPVTESTAVPTPTVAPTGVVVPVFALDNSFRPDRIEIEVGDEVLWENRGLNEHNVLYVEGADWGVQVESFQPGDVYSHVFTEPGEYRYYCSIHGSTEVGMVGMIIVAG
jgi:plastocyanin